MKAQWQQLDYDELCWAVEEVDPDWNDHFVTIEQAAHFYEESDEFIEAVNQVLEEDEDEDDE